MMKKLLSLLLTLALLMTGVAAAAAGMTRQSGDYTYVILEDGTAEITKYKGKTASLDIPAALDGVPVTGIGNDAFVSYSSLTSITIPDSVTSIGDSAFSYCGSLTSVTIPDSVAEIGINPFADCSSMSSINVSPGNSAFETADGVLFSKADRRLICYPALKAGTEYSIPQGTASIGNNALNGCSSLTSVSIPASVTSIGSWAFEGCSSLTSVSIPASVTNIGKDAFIDCSGLTLTVVSGSYAEQYAVENNLAYILQ